MPVNTPNLPLSPPVKERASGRAYLWTGIGACLLGLALVFVQFSLKRLFVPWYSPILASVGAIFVLLSVARRRSVVRIVVLLLVAAFAAYQWYFLVSLMKLPDYTGPVQAGKPLPPFQATLADGQPFTDADLHDGSRQVLTFFRGRW